MTETHEIRSPEFSHNMAGWCSEKSGHIVRDVARIIDLVKNSQIDSHTKEMLEGHLDSVAWDSTKLLSFATGAAWEPKHARAIRNHGFSGYEAVALEYGCIRETERQSQMRDVLAFLDHVSPLIAGEQVPNRTLLHELLRETDLQHKIISLIADSVEKVTMRDMKWHDFQQQIQPEIAALRDQLNEEMNAPSLLASL
jgi:hypothetical protein